MAFKIPVAIDVETGQYVLPDEAQSEREYTCAGCGAGVKVRRGYVRKNGSVVRTHLYHHDSSASCGSKESWQHIELKALIIARHREGLLRTTPVCPECGKTPLLREYDREWLAEEECVFGKYRLDVGFRDRATGKVVAAVEVFHTHEVGKDKREALDEGLLFWDEIPTREEYDEALSYHHKGVCEDCLFRIMKRAESWVRWADRQMTQYTHAGTGEYGGLVSKGRRYAPREEAWDQGQDDRVYPILDTLFSTLTGHLGGPTSIARWKKTVWRPLEARRMEFLRNAGRWFKG